VKAKNSRLALAEQVPGDSVRLRFSCEFLRKIGMEKHIAAGHAAGAVIAKGCHGSDLESLDSPFELAWQEAALGGELLGVLVDVADLLPGSGSLIGGNVDREAIERTLQYGLIVASNLFQRPTEFLESLQCGIEGKGCEQAAERAGKPGGAA